MRLLIPLFTCLLLLLIFSQTLPAASFQSIGAGARAQALGNTFVGLADDPSAVYWNPAGLTQIASPALLLMDRVTTLDTNYANLAGVLPLSHLGTFGLNVIFHRVDQIPVFDEAGNGGGDITEQEGSLTLSYAYRYRDLSLGLSLKGLFQRMDAVEALDAARTQTWGTGLDVAVLYHLTERFQVGVRLQDEITLRDWEDEAQYSAAIPRTITSGLVYRQPISDEHQWLVMADIEQRHELPLSLHLGTELSLYRTFALRAGLNDVTMEKRGASIAWDDLFRANLKPTAGFGLSRAFNHILLRLDYAASFERLGVRSFVSLSVMGQGTE